MAFASLYALVRVETTSATTLGRLDRLAIHDHHRWTSCPSGMTTGLLVEHSMLMDPHTGVLPGLKVMVDRAIRWKLAGQQSPLAASPQEVKDGVEDGTKFGGARSPTWSRRRQNRRNKSPRRVGQVGVVQSSAHRTVPLARSALFQGRRQLFKHPLRE